MRVKTNYIVDKAAALFAQNGLRSVSMDEIASYAGISKRTLYVNFQSKEIIVSTIVQRSISQTSKYIRLCPDISPNAIKEVENFSEHILGAIEILTPRFIRDLKKYYPEIYARLIAFINDPLMPYLEYCLSRGITEENFRPGINKKITGWLYLWQVQNAVEGDKSHEDAYMIIANLNDLFLYGILNAKGLKMYSGGMKIVNTRKRKVQGQSNLNHLKY